MRLHPQAQVSLPQTYLWREDKEPRIVLWRSKLYFAKRQDFKDKTPFLALLIFFAKSVHTRQMDFLFPLFFKHKVFFQ